MSFFDTVPDGFLPTAEEAAELDARNQGRRQQLLPEEAKETDSEGSEIDDTNPTTNLNCPGSRLLLKPTTRLKPSTRLKPTIRLKPSGQFLLGRTLFSIQVCPKP
jgi:hypothetical protein